MGDWPQGQDFNRVTISSCSLESLGAFVAATRSASTNSVAWPAANRAFFVPFVVYTPVVIAKMFFENGATINGAFDIGIYDSQANRLVSSGSTAHSGANAFQTVDISDTTLIPGVYYMALCFDGTTATVRSYTGSVAPLWGAAGVLMQDLGSVTLPNPATFAAYAGTLCPHVTLTARTLI